MSAPDPKRACRRKSALGRSGDGSSILERNAYFRMVLESTWPSQMPCGLDYTSQVASN